MPSKKQVLESKLEKIKNQKNHNIMIGLVGIFFLFFWDSLGILLTMGFILFTGSVIRGFSLRTKIKKLEAELSIYNQKKVM